MDKLRNRMEILDEAKKRVRLKSSSKKKLEKQKKALRSRNRSKKRAKAGRRLSIGSTPEWEELRGMLENSFAKERAVFDWPGGCTGGDVVEAASDAVAYNAVEMQDAFLKTLVKKLGRDREYFGGELELYVEENDRPEKSAELNFTVYGEYSYGGLEGTNLEMSADEVEGDLEDAVGEAYYKMEQANEGIHGISFDMETPEETDFEVEVTADSSLSEPEVDFDRGDGDQRGDFTISWAIHVDVDTADADRECHDMVAQEKKQSNKRRADREWERGRADREWEREHGQAAQDRWTADDEAQYRADQRRKSNAWKLGSFPYD